MSIAPALAPTQPQTTPSDSSDLGKLFANLDLNGDSAPTQPQTTPSNPSDLEKLFANLGLNGDSAPTQPQTTPSDSSDLDWLFNAAGGDLAVLLQLVADRLAENEIKSQKDNLKNRGAIKNAVKENNSEVRDERKNAANWAFAAKIVSGVTTIGMSAASMAPLKGGGDVGLEHSRMMGRTGDAVSGAEMGVGDFVSSTQNAEANLKEANGQVETSEIGISQDRANRSQDNASKAAAIKEEMQRQKVNIDRGIAEMMR